MRPALRWALGATVLATGAAAWWPEDSPVLPRPAAMAQRPVPAAPGATAAPPVLVAVRPPLSAEPQPAAVPPGLPTRPADWPPVPAQALAAWQGADRQGANAARELSSARPAQGALPSAPASATSAPAAPTMPPFPYRWIGELDDGSGVQLLLANASRTTSVRDGEQIDGRWRLQRSAAGQWEAQPLPVGEKQAVPGAPAQRGPL